MTKILHWSSLCQSIQLSQMQHVHARCQLCRTSKWACNQWMFFFSCDQAALRTLLSICPSVTPFWQCFCHRILKISRVITIDRRDVHAKGQGQKRCPIVLQGHPSNFKVTRLKKVVNFDPNWAFPDCNSSLFFEVIHQISRSLRLKNRWLESNF